MLNFFLTPLLLQDPGTARIGDFQLGCEVKVKNL